MEGYQFTTEGATPEWYRLDPETQLRRSGKTTTGEWKLEATPPTQVMRMDISGSVYPATILPPYATWFEGFYASEARTEEEKKLAKEISPNDQYFTWIVDGEGTPGNWLARAYKLPDRIAKTAPPPKHPSNWPKERSKSYGSGWEYSSSPKTSALPLGLLIRCMGCGHWYGETKLKDHVTAACPGMQGGTTEWVIPCSCCGENIDIMAVCKQGFPKKTKKPDVVAVQVEAPEAAPVP